MFTSTLSPALAALNYTYDANGNATTDGTNCYEYNDANQLKKVKLCSNNQTIAEYIYDYQGNRIEKKLYTGGNLLKTVYSPNDTYEATKLASNGATTNVSYYFVNDELAAKKNSDGSKNYFLNDHLGSMGIMTNSAGTAIETTQYYPYGLVRAGGTKNKFLYTGQEKDPETGLDYYNFRYYNSQLGRFIQPDDQLQTPFDPQSLNNYSYVKNNPIKYTDPTGHQGTLALKALFSNPYTAVFALGGGAFLYVIYPPIRPNVNKAVSQAYTNLQNYNKTLATKPTRLSQSTQQKGASKNPNSNPFQRIAPFVPPIVNESGKWKSNATVNQGLDAAEKWLGDKYQEIAPWVFRSADNLRQFRMTDRDILDKNPHFNFEVVKEGGRVLGPNLHLYLNDFR